MSLSEGTLKALKELGLTEYEVPFVLWNVTGMFNLEKVRPSYKIMKEILAYVKG